MEKLEKGVQATLPKINELQVYKPLRASRACFSFPPTDYHGHVPGRHVGSKLSGHAIVSLTSIEKSDERLFGWKVFLKNVLDVSQLDVVNLLGFGG